MIGKILGIDEDGLAGVIRGEDGNRYKFTVEDIKNSSEPKVNDSVDFDIEEKSAKDIYITKSNSIDMSAMNDKVSEFGNKMKGMNIPKVNIPKDVKIPKFLIKNNLPIVAAFVLILVLIFSYYKNTKIEEEFIKLISEQKIYNVKYKDYGCSGIFSTNCYLEDVQLFSRGSLDFEAETFEITNISGLTDIATSNKIVEIPFSVELDGIKVSDKLEQKYLKSLITSSRRVSMQEKERRKEIYDYVISNLNSKAITLDGKLEVANKKASSIEIKELSYDNNIIPLLIDFKISNLDQRPTLSYLTLKVSTDKLLGFAYDTIKYLENNPNFEENIKKVSKDIKCLDKESFEEIAKKFIAASIKADRKMKDIYKNPLLDLFAHDAEGIKINFENKNNYSFDNLLFMVMMGSNNLSALERKLKFEVIAYGDKSDDILPDYNAEELSKFKKSVIDKIRSKNKEELAKLNEIKEKLATLKSKESIIDEEILEQHITKNLSKYNNVILPKIKNSHLAKSFMNTYNKKRYKTVILNNKKYTLESAYRKLKQIKVKAPAKYEDALNKVVDKFEPFGYDRTFLANHMKNSINKSKYNLRIRYSNRVANFYSKINFDSNSKSQMKKIYQFRRYIPYELRQLRSLVNIYKNSKNSNPKKSSLYREIRELENRKNRFEKQLSAVNQKIDKVNYCKSRACVELINYKYQKFCN